MMISVAKQSPNAMSFGNNKPVDNVQNRNKTVANQQPSKKLQNSDKSTTQKPVYAKNPIKKSGELVTAIGATISAGVIFALRLLLTIGDDGEGAEFLFEEAKKISNKVINNNTVRGQRVSNLRKAGGFLAVLGLFVAVPAAVYTIYNMPKAMYIAKVNAFKKGKQMDVYIRQNSVEKELYDQMNEKAKNATADDKAKLNEQYMKLRAAKNVVPDFVKLKNKELEEQQKTVKALTVA